MKGNPVINASMYDVAWEMYENLTKTIDGQSEFEISPAEHVTGIPVAGGKGDVIPDVVVDKQKTGYEERTKQSISISDSPEILRVIQESSLFETSLPFDPSIMSKMPDYRSDDFTVDIDVIYK